MVGIGRREGRSPVRVYLCLTQQHDLRLVVLAALICLFATYTALSVIRLTRATAGRARLSWLATAGGAAGGGIRAALEAAQAMLDRAVAPPASAGLVLAQAG